MHNAFLGVKPRDKQCHSLRYRVSDYKWDPHNSRTQAILGQLCKKKEYFFPFEVGLSKIPTLFSPPVPLYQGSK